MILLLIGFGGGVVIGFVLCGILRGIRAGQQFDEGYRMGMDTREAMTLLVIEDDQSPRWYVRPPDGDWLPTTEAVARSIEDDGWRVLKVEREAK